MPQNEGYVKEGHVLILLYICAICGFNFQQVLMGLVRMFRFESIKPQKMGVWERFGKEKTNFFNLIQHLSHFVWIFFFWLESC